MDLYGHFNYAGRSSRNLGLIIANVETDRFTSLSGTIESTTVFDKANKRNYIVGTNYSESPLSFEIDIVTDDNRPLWPYERRRIEKWLFLQRDYCKLYSDLFEDFDNETFDVVDGGKKQLYLNCRFANPEKLEYNGGIIGYRCTLESDSGFLWQEPITKVFNLPNISPDDSTIIELNIDTDINDYTYPKVTFDIGESGGDIVVFNDSDDPSRQTKFIDVLPNDFLTMKGEINQITGIGYDKFSGQNFIRLLDGVNRICVTGDVSQITFEWQNRRYF